jgi:predicted Na+-dependent transporter
MLKDSLLRLNHAMDRFIPVITPLSVALGLLFPVFFLPLRPYVILLFSIMTFSGALKLTAVELGSSVKNPAPILLFFFSSHVIMPLAALFLSSQFIKNSDVVAGFVVLFAGPTAVSGFIWSAIFKGDKALGLSLILLDTLLAPLVVPATLSIFMGAKIAMDMRGIAVSLIFMVVVPTIIAVALNETSKGAIPQKICPIVDPFAKFCLMLVIAANSAAIAHIIKFNDPIVWITGALCLCLTSAGFLLAKFNGSVAKCGNEKTTALVIAGGLRNNSAVMTIAVTFLPQAAVLPTLMSIILQQTIAAVMGRLIIRRRIHSEEQIHQE